jgi:hypothetical protein
LFFFFFDQFVKFAEKYGIEISIDELKAFEQFLIQHPMLGTKNSVGEKLFEAIRRHKEASEGFILEKSSRTGNTAILFRGRNRKSDSFKAFTSSEMWSPPAGYASHGRYNAIGIPVLYLTDNIESIPYELHTADDEVIDIATFHLERDLVLFDIGEFDSEFEGFFLNARTDSRLLKHSYLLPNFVGACCDFLGYDGVKFIGARGKGFIYTNYALFNYKNEVDVSIVGNPVTFKQKNKRRLEK